MNNCCRPETYRW